jgi:serine/threonine-protein kinase
MSESEAERDPFEVVVESFLAHYRAGERPSLAEYARRHPELREEIWALFPTLIEMEGLAPPAHAGGALPTLQLPQPGAGGPAVRQSEQVPAPAAVPPRYELIGEIARGGMGAVLYAHDKDLGRDLAVKVLLTEHASRPESLRRFAEEVQIGGQLQHPGIVPVYDVGRFGDLRPYFTMKLVQGRTLAALLAERSEPGQDRPQFLRVFQQVARTLAYAHSKGVIHRDLKPSNVMVGAFGEVQVMDWGLAKVLPDGGAGAPESRPDEAAIGRVRTVRGLAPESQPGDVIGTPAYMPPEQASGAVDRLDRRADVFGLGAILCEVLTGQPPYTGEDVHRKAARGDQAEAMDRLERCGAEEELIALAKSCLAPEASARPADAGAVADAVTGYLDGVQERLRRAEVERAEAQARAAAEGEARAAAQARALAERRARRLTAGLAAAVLALLAAGAGGGLLAQRGAAERRQAVESALVKAEGLRQQGRWGEAQAVLGEARRTLGGAGPDDLRRRLDGAEATLELVRRLDAIAQGRALTSQGRRNKRTTESTYADAFAKAGLLGKVGEDDEEAVAARVRASGVTGPLVAALVNWAFVTDDARTRRWALEVARRADPDPWGDRFRDPDIWGNPQGLQDLAREVLREDAARLSPQVLVALGGQLLGNHAYADAVRLLGAAQSQYPADFWLNLFLGDALLKTKQADKALAYDRVAVALRPDSTAARNNLGLALYHTGQFDAAIAEYNQAIRLDPQYALAHLNLGLALLAKGDLKGALAACEEATRLFPDYAAAHFHLGRILRATGQLDEAIREYREAIRLDPGLAAAHNNLGLALQDKGEWDGAIEEYTKAIDCDANLVEAYVNLGSARRQQGRREDAIDLYRRAIEVNPNFVPAHYNLGCSLGEKGDLRGAVGEYQRAIALNENYVEAYYYLGLALRETGDHKGAIDAYRTAARLYGERSKPTDDPAVGHRYNAACCAALAVAVLAEDPSRLPEQVAPMLRRQALQWLRADLALYAKQANLDAAALRHWQEDRDLAPLRDPEALGRLPDDDRQQWRRLWAEVDALLKPAGR